MAVALTTVLAIESALGKDLSAAEEARATYYINTISAYVASYCDRISFEIIEDDVKRTQADYYGVIELGGGPISEVASVASVDGTEVGGWTFDGVRQISGLAPFQAVDVTYSHGVEEIPEDLKGVVTDVVSGIFQAQVSGPIKTRTVGDVTYVFQEGQNIGVSLEAGVLKQYRTTEYTMRLGQSHSHIDRPINWFQISG